MTAATALGGYNFWTDESGRHARAVLAAEGIRCAACSRSIERALRGIAGVDRVTVNVATSRICVDWRAEEATLDQIVDAITNAGFKPLPLAGEASEAAFMRERRAALKRIGLAGLGMMQVMMYVLGVYVADPGSIDPSIARYLSYVGMVITTPVLLYSGAPFLLGAMRDLKRRALGMDVPVAIALVLAYGASVFNTLRGTGQTYFDSVTMFIFFLGAGRYVEMIVRQRSLSVSEAMSRSLPAFVTRRTPSGGTERVAVAQIAEGDRLVIPKGGVIPVDAELAAGAAWVDESLVTGEATAIRRDAGELLLGGGVNVGNPIEVEARRDVSGSTLASIAALLERAQAARPAVARVADRAANLFIAGILVVAALVAIVWMAYDPSRAFPATLAVLVVTCPCALSLATPVAVAAASTRLARQGLLATRADALERLARVRTVVLDKTGTLTTGRPVVQHATAFDGIGERSALQIAGALSRVSTHPVASAFIAYADSAVVAHDVVEVEGQGMQGAIDGVKWRLGRRDFVVALAQGRDGEGLPRQQRASATSAIPTDQDGLYLGNEKSVCAAFELGEDLRPDARAALDTFRSLGVEPVIASGDGPLAVERVAGALAVAHAQSRLEPNKKIELVREFQRAGSSVLTIGDGVNDGPVLAASDVSCAMGQGSAIAQAAADFLLLNDSLSVVARAVATAREMLRVIRQNLRWAILYNVAAIPLAALDLVPPWLAAIGMSASSLLVVLNASRLAGGRQAA